jgi:hypothetical protein
LARVVLGDLKFFNKIADHLSHHRWEEAKFAALEEMGVVLCRLWRRGGGSGDHRVCDLHDGEFIRNGGARVRGVLRVLRFDAVAGDGYGGGELATLRDSFGGGAAAVPGCAVSRGVCGWAAVSSRVSVHAVDVVGQRGAAEDGTL